MNKGTTDVKKYPQRSYQNLVTNLCTDSLVNAEFISKSDTVNKKWYNLTYPNLT